MKAITKSVYGGPEVLQLEEVEKPAVAADEILVEVKANSANPADWHILRGTPFLVRLSFGLLKPKNKVLGADFAGIVKQVGEKVTGVKVGDRVFGEKSGGGAFAEYVSVPVKACATMPEAAGFAEMACLPVAGLTALQAVLTHGNLQARESILINGASGGVGHLAVQIAKAQGAEVTGVCSSAKVDFVKSLGADRVIAYDQEDVHTNNGQYDLVLDIHGNLTFRDFKRMGRRGVLVGFTTMSNMVSVMLSSALSKFSLAQFTAEATRKDLEALADLIESGKLSVHIEKTYPYQEIPAAISYIEAMRTKGKVSMLWG